MAATRNELPEFCPHVACAHTKPEHGMDLRDNVDNLLEVITALFLALESDNVQLSELGVDLCGELKRRIELFGEAHLYFE